MRSPRWLGLSLSLVSTVAGSQPAAWRIERPELRGSLAGRVCRDHNQDGRCSDDEPGIPRARVVMETGQEAWTDDSGRYHLVDLEPREPAVGPLRFRTGRHRLRVDPTTLPWGLSTTATGVTVELPMGAVVLQDFPLPSPKAPGVATSLPSLSPAQHPAAARVEGAQWRYAVRGRALPDDQILIEGLSVTPERDGRFEAWVSLQAGSNTVALSLQNPREGFRALSQQIDVVVRQEDALFIPRGWVERAQIAPMADGQETPEAGLTTLRAQAAEGTRIIHEGRAYASKEGAAQIPVELHSGRNDVHLEVLTPEGQVVKTTLNVTARSRAWVVGLLDLETSYGLNSRSWLFRGRGAAHGEARVGRWLLEGELDLRDEDFRSVALGPRAPQSLVRALDPEDFPHPWSDNAFGATPNSAEAMLRFRAVHPVWGSAGVGTQAAALGNREIGVYDRIVWGPYLQARLPPALPWQASAQLFGVPRTANPASGIVGAPAHEEHRSTGSSFFYLRHAPLIEGTERIRIQHRDGATGLVLSEQKLTRGVDYELDASAGRLILSQPLVFFSGPAFLGMDAWLGSTEPVMQVDYEYLVLASDAQAALGADAVASWRGLSLGGGAVRETGTRGGFTLGAGRGGIDSRWGSLHVELASSRGIPWALQGLSQSADGGWMFQQVNVATARAGGEALSTRIFVPVPNQGRWNAQMQFRSPGFADGSVWTPVAERRWALRGDQPVGPLNVRLLGDHHEGVDPRLPYGTTRATSRTVGVSVGRKTGDAEFRVEAKDVSVMAANNPQQGTPVLGERTSAGVLGLYQLTPRWAIRASHQQSLSRRGSGPGAFNDTLSTVGTDVRISPSNQIGVTLGYGPSLGPLVMSQWKEQTDGIRRYSAYNVDVEGVDIGQHHAITGARFQTSTTTEVFVEDRTTAGTNGAGRGQTLGVSQALGAGWSTTLLYDRGARSVLGTAPLLTRDGGGASVQWMSERAQLSLRADVRAERGAGIFASDPPVNRIQGVLSGWAHWRMSEAWSASTRLNWMHSMNQGLLEGRMLEANVGIAWRKAPFLGVLRGTVERDRPGGFGISAAAGSPFPERTLWVASFLPAVQWGPRFRMGSGIHAGVSVVEATTRTVVSASLRPSFRVFGGLELAIEGACRTAATQGDALTALRGEVAYRFDRRFLLAAGYTVIGFSGVGVGSASDRVDRLYLRAEVGE